MVTQDVIVVKYILLNNFLFYKQLNNYEKDRTWIRYNKEPVDKIKYGPEKTPVHIFVLQAVELVTTKVQLVSCASCTLKATDSICCPSKIFRMKISLI